MPARLRGRRHVRIVAALAALAVAPVPGVAVEAPTATATVAAASAVDSIAPRPPAVRSEHVIVISIDGLRPDAIAAAGAVTLQRMVREGSFSAQAQTIPLSKTLPSHTSMVTGVGPEVHGITWNSDLTPIYGKVRVPTMFEIARESGLVTAAFFSKSKFHHLEVPGTLDLVESPWGWFGSWRAEVTVRHVEEELGEARPNLTFVHFGEPDYAGHEHGWMEPEYLDAVRKADWAVARVLEEADAAFGAGEYTVIVTADHGGHAHEHGHGTPEHRTIPWLAWGKGVSAGVALAEGIRTMDTAATTLWLLGVTVPAHWEGQPVAGAFDVLDPADRSLAGSD